MYVNPGLNPSQTPLPPGTTPIAGLPAAAPAVAPAPTGLQPVTNEDGSVDFVEPDTDRPELSDVLHDANLAEAMDEGLLGKIGQELLEGIEADEESNAGMYATFEEGLKFVAAKPGMRLDKPFKGAAGCVHPLLLEAVIRFQANARGEMLPAAGPVRSQVNGDGGPGAEAIAKRKSDWLNYYLTTKDEDYYPDFDQMLLLVGLYGSMFRKVYRDPAKRGMPVSRALTPTDLVVSYSATGLHGSGRVTHVEHHVSPADIKRLQLKAWYRDTPLTLPEDDEPGEAERITADSEGRTASERPEDATYKLYHCHCLLDLDGLEHRDEAGEPTGLPLPYIVTLDADSGIVLRIARNWTEGDKEYSPREYYVHFQYMPGFGFYGWGLIHLLGSVTDALTMMRRQSLNAFTLKTHPGGVRVKGARPEHSDNAVGPGEFLEIDTGGLPIQQAVMPMPFADVPASFEPILQELLESGQRLGSIGDMAVGEGREDALPGTVIALIEKAVKLEASVIKRLHTAQRKELRLLADLFGADPDAKYDYVVGGKRGQALAGDFKDNEDIVPVSDPNIPTQTQRLAQAQAVMSMADSSGGIVDRRAAYETFFRTMGKSDQEIAVLMPPPQQGQPSDPVTEFAAVMKGLPLKAGIQQNHMAHIQAHMAQISTPNLAKTPAYQPLLAHIGEHVGLFYAGEASRLTGIPMLPGQIPQGQEPVVAQAVAAASEQLRLALAQIQPAMGDPLEAAKVQVEMQKLALDRDKLQIEAQNTKAKDARAGTDAQVDLMKLKAQLVDNAAERQSSENINQNETARALLSMRTAEISANADVAKAAVERDATIGEKLVDHASTAKRADADVEIAHEQTRTAKQETETERHATKGEEAKARAAVAKARTPVKKGPN